MSSEPTPTAIVAAFLPCGTPEDPCKGFPPAFAPIARAILTYHAPTNPLEAIAVARAILAAHTLHLVAHAPLPDADDLKTLTDHQRTIRTASRYLDTTEAQIRRLRRPAPQPKPTPRPRANPQPKPQPATPTSTLQQKAQQADQALTQMRQTILDLARRELPHDRVEAILNGTYPPPRT
jgi:hypothetical protein